MSANNCQRSNEQIIKITKIDNTKKYFNVFFMERGTIRSATFKGLRDIESVIEVISMLHIIKILNFCINNRPELIDEIKSKFSQDNFWEFNLEESN